MSELASWAAAKNGWWNMKVMGPIKGIYEGVAIGKSKFGEAPVYSFKVGGELKRFQSTSKFLAKMMDKIGIGTMVEISREGSGNETKYTVNQLQLHIPF